MQEGIAISKVLAEFNATLQKAKYAVGHNIGFDVNIVGSESYREAQNSTLQTKIVLP